MSEIKGNVRTVFALFFVVFSLIIAANVYGASVRLPNDGMAVGAPVATTTIFVAANDSTAEAKATADYVVPDGAQNAQDTINIAINALPQPQGGKVLLRAGTYLLNNFIELNGCINIGGTPNYCPAGPYNNVSFEGEGPSTVIRAVAGAASPMLRIPNYYTPEAYTIANMTIDGNAVVTSTPGNIITGISISQVKNFLLKNLVLINAAKLYISGPVEDVAVQNNVIKDAPMEFTVTRLLVDGNTTEYTGYNGIVPSIWSGILYVRGNNVTITNNFAINSGGLDISAACMNISFNNYEGRDSLQIISQIAALSGGFTVANNIFDKMGVRFNAADAMINNNTFLLGGTAAISHSVWITGNTAGPLVFSGNTITGNNSSISYIGLRAGGYNLTVTGNIVTGAGGTGIYLLSATAAVVSNNTITGNNQFNSGSFFLDGIWVYSSSGTILQGNTVRYGSNPNKHRYGLYISNSTNVVVENNDLLTSGITANFMNSGTGTVIGPGNIF